MAPMSQHRHQHHQPQPQHIHELQASFVDVGNVTETIVENFSNNNDNITDLYNDEHFKRLSEFHIIKAVVLSVVTIVILLSVCKMVFAMILKYPDRSDK